MDGIFSEVLKPTIDGSDLDLICRRSDTPVGNIVQGIVRDLDEATVVVADITGCNPNVMYELGARHALQRRTVMITRSLAGVPFDLRPYAILEYEASIGGLARFRMSLLDIVGRVLLESERPDSPIGDYLSVRRQAVSSLSSELAERQAAALIDELTIAMVVLKTAARWAIVNNSDLQGNPPEQEAQFVVPTVRTPALEHLLATASIGSRGLRANARALLGLIDAALDTGRAPGRRPLNGALAFAAGALVALEHLQIFRTQVIEVAQALQRGESAGSVAIKGFALAGDLAGEARGRIEDRTYLQHLEAIDYVPPPGWLNI